MSKQHRGRIQAQGEGTEKLESWSQDEPLTKADGLKLLDHLENQLSEKERKEREKQLKEVRRFIENAAGISAVKKKSFYGNDKGAIRIDIEVLGGIAFVCFLIVVLLFLFGFK